MLQFMGLQSIGHYCATELTELNCISDSFVDHGGYSISSKGFLPAVVDVNGHLS